MSRILIREDDEDSDLASALEVELDTSNSSLEGVLGSDDDSGVIADTLGVESPSKKKSKPKKTPTESDASASDTAAGSARKANPAGVPEDFTLVGFMDDPEGAQDDPRYQGSDGRYDPLLDYKGIALQYDIYVRKDVVKSREDFTEANKPYVVFRVRTDMFNSTKPPYNKKRDYNFRGLVIFSNGATEGKKPWPSFNVSMEATYNELYNALAKGLSLGSGNLNLPDSSPAGGGASTTPAAPPPTTPAPPVAAPPPAGSGSFPEPPAASAAPSAPSGGGEGAGGDIRDAGAGKKKGDCCHTDRVLDYNCYVESNDGDFQNNMTESIYYKRGIRKGKHGYNVHYINDMTGKTIFGGTKDYIIVATTGNTLIDLATGANIQEIVINLGDQRFSSKRGDREFSADLQRLKERVRNVKVFLTQNDPCFISDQKIRNDNLVDFRPSLRESEIRDQIKKILSSL